MPKQIDNEEFYYLKEVAEEAGRPVPTLRRWMRDEKVSCEKRYEASRGRLLLSTAEKDAIVSYANGIRKV